jgi:hypothetical protein
MKKLLRRSIIVALCIVAIHFISMFWDFERVKSTKPPIFAITIPVMSDDAKIVSIGIGYICKRTTHIMPPESGLRWIEVYQIEHWFLPWDASYSRESEI